jgi:hypothetical protein
MLASVGITLNLTPFGFIFILLVFLFLFSHTPFCHRGIVVDPWLVCVLEFVPVAADRRRNLVPLPPLNYQICFSNIGVVGSLGRDLFKGEVTLLSGILPPFDVDTFAHRNRTATSCYPLHFPRSSALAKSPKNKGHIPVLQHIAYPVLNHFIGTTACISTPEFHIC